MQVLPDGKKEVSDKTNVKDRFIVKPSGGSSSQPVTNYKIFSKLTVSLLPPENKIHR